MNLRVQLIVAIGVVFALAAFAQPNVTTDSPFQVRYAANVHLLNTPQDVDSFVNVTNTGATGGNICVNVYTFDASDEQLVSCCSCVVTPNQNRALSVKQDLISNTLTPGMPSDVVVKLLATTGAACNAATPGALTAGMAAWMTTTHAAPGGGWAVTETAFTPATLSAAELARASSFCGFIQANGSGFGICRSCRAGALAAGKK